MKKYVKRQIYNVKKVLPNDIGVHIFDVVNKSIKYAENWKLESNKNAFNKWCHWYIWKIFKDKDKREDMIYSDDFILWSLSYLFWLGTDDIFIELGSVISKLMNWKEDMEWVMSVDEVVKHITDLAKKYFPDDYDRLNFINIDENNSILFSMIKNHGISILDWRNKIEESVDTDIVFENFTSYDIAKYLYAAVKFNKRLATELASIKPEGVESNNDNFAEYYTLVEVSLRLYDFLKNPEIMQWGNTRQRKYDKIILLILNWDLSENQELQKLQSFCKTILKKTWKDNAMFLSVWLDMAKYKKSLSKIRKKNNIRRKKMNIVASISLAILTTIWWWVWMAKYLSHKNETKMELLVDNMIKDILKDKSIFIWFEHKSLKFDASERKLEYIKWMLLSFAKKIKARYDINNELSYVEWEYFIADDLLKGKVINELWHSDWKDNVAEEEFITNFIKENKVKLVANGIDIVPYNKFRKYEYLFKDVLKQEVDINYSASVQVTPSMYIEKYRKDKIWEYVDMWWSVYRLALLKERDNGSIVGSKAITDRWKWLALSKPIYDFSWTSGDLWYKIDWWTEYSTKWIADLAVDYFMVTQPDIQIAIDNLWDQYYDAVDEYSKWNYSASSYDMKNTIKNILVRSWVKHDMKNKISNDSKNNKINNFLKNIFVKDSHDMLVSMWFDTDPYAKYKKYEWIFNNTIKYWDKIKESKDLFYFGINELVEYKYENIWLYRDSKWDEYSLYIVNIDWKEYLVANNYSDEISWNEYSFMDAMDVIADYFHISKK